jgi:hypothetical protein
MKHYLVRIIGDCCDADYVEISKVVDESGLAKIRHDYEKYKKFVDIFKRENPELDYEDYVDDYDPYLPEFYPYGRYGACHTIVSVEYAEIVTEFQDLVKLR